MLTREIFYTIHNNLITIQNAQHTQYIRKELRINQLQQKIKYRKVLQNKLNLYKMPTFQRIKISILERKINGIYLLY
jgi:hypothetical protein